MDSTTHAYKSGRKVIGDAAEKQVESYLMSHHYAYQVTSYERLLPPELLRQVTLDLKAACEKYPWLKLLRYTPDFRLDIEDGKTIWVEAKGGHSLERDAYLAYMRRDAVEPVYIAIAEGGTVKLCRVSCLPFQDSDWRIDGGGSGLPYKWLDMSSGWQTRKVAA